MSRFVDVEVDVKEVEKILKRYTIRTSNLDMSIAALALETAISDVIDSEGRLSNRGRKWNKLKQSTLERRPRRIGGMLLQDTGLLKAIESRVEDWAAFAFSPAPYAKFHVTGAKRTKMVKRDYTDVRWGPLLEDVADSLLMEVVTP